MAILIYQSYDMKCAANIVNAKPTKLREALLNQDVFYRDYNQALCVRLKYIEAGYFTYAATEHKRGPVRHITNKIMATPNGIEFLREFCANNNVPRARTTKNETQAA